MKIRSLEVVNIQAVQRVAIENASRVVLIAGPNGCGKSSIFDSIRLLKSMYGGYQANEWHQWFGEYGINLNRRSVSIDHLFRDKTKPIVISADLELTASEKSYLRNNLTAFADRMAWEIVAPHTQKYGIRPVARDLRVYQDEVNKRRKEIIESVTPSLDNELHKARVEINGNLIKTEKNPLLEVLFSVYEPEHIGIIDFHGSNRVYNRENLSGINLDLESEEQRRRQSSLYNYGQKYTNIKSEMATSYIRKMLANELGQQYEEAKSLTETLKEMFRTFFPDKEFLGPVPTENHAISFPVRVAGGIEHDINDLSSGEKEVLFGYLRLRNNSPKSSVILLDEPELHLNPGLIRGLPQFYKKHLAEELDNQLWLVTHSDAFLREAAGQHGFDVFHMQHANQMTSFSQNNQLTRVSIEEDIEQAVIDLVGDLASFKPGSPVIIFEGEDSEFDIKMTCRLFPEVQQSFNPISAGNKTNARKLHRLLEKAAEKTRLSSKFFTIVDKDHETVEKESENSFIWPVYHIENFLLEPKYILLVLKDLSALEDVFSSEEEVESALKDAAEETVVDLLRHRLQNYANDNIIKLIKVETDRTKLNVAECLRDTVESSRLRINKFISDELSLDNLRLLEKSEKNELEEALTSGAWRQKFRGRNVLKRFLNNNCKGKINYNTFRDLIIARMRDKGFKPAGMQSVLNKVISAATSEAISKKELKNKKKLAKQIPVAKAAPKKETASKKKEAVPKKAESLEGKKKKEAAKQGPKGLNKQVTKQPNKKKAKVKGSKKCKKILPNGNPCKNLPKQGNYGFCGVHRKKGG